VESAPLVLVIDYLVYMRDWEHGGTVVRFPNIRGK
jgi:hypothetical protein